MHEDEIPVGRAKDLRGQKFSHLTVLYRVKNKGKKVAWKCKCDCGNTTIVAGDNLTRKKYKTTSCGCRIGHKIIGEQYGDLTIVEDLGIYDNRHICKCRCSCGKIISVRYNNLVSGNTTSCGDRKAHGVRCNWNDLTGQRFGSLLVLKETEKRVDNKIVWECKCDCGNHVYVISSNLIRGNTTSCGCLMSKGEQKCISLLTDSNIEFTTQQSFDTCIFPDSGRKARFDFFIQNSYLVEYDGSQHFNYSSNDKGWNTKEQFEKTQQRDAYKNQWCKDNNIPLIRIPYTKLDTLCIEDLMLETTEFRVV